MNFTQAITTCFHKYADFSGRARRSEYWYFWLFNSIMSFLLMLIFSKMPFIGTLYSLATLVPSMAVGWRRMHDIGKSGAWMLLSFVPVVGMIIVIIWLCRDGQPGVNAYGPNVK